MHRLCAISPVAAWLPPSTMRVWGGGLGWVAGARRVALGSWVRAAPNPGATGSQTATASPGSAAGIGQLVAIRPRPYIAVRSSATASGASVTSLAINKPTGTSSGDVLIGAISSRGLPTITPPAGWTLIRGDVNTVVMTQALYVHVAGGSEPATYSWSFSSSVTAVVGGISTYTGVDTGNPIDTSGGQANASS